MEASVEDITQCLERHAKIFDDLLRLIPPKFYLPSEDDDGEQAGNSRYMKNTKKATSAAEKDAQRKGRASAKAARLDPASNKTVQELQAEKLEQQISEKASDAPGDAKKSKKQKKPNGNASAKDPTANGTANSEHDHESRMSGMAIDLDGTGAGAAAAAASDKAEITPMSAPGSIGELRQRLQERIENLRQKRGAPEDDVSREALLEKRLKRRKSTKAAKKGTTGAAASKEQVLGSKTPSANGGTEAGADGSAPAKDHIFFGRLTTGMIKKKKGTNAKQQLAKVENKKKELDELRAEDAAKADKIEEKDKWGKALDLAKGEKVRDDPKLLRKTIRRDEQQKKKSARQWSDRKQEVADKIKDRVGRRDANIKARSDAKKMKKDGKSKKVIARTLKAAKASAKAGSKGSKGAKGSKSSKGGSKARPGFEGKPSRK
ncbi:hypothetical protein H4R19_003050 [Coemansia spiralis]|nr:hypothetical protein H4R19_003050 [Coemansia spiralis]